MKSSRVFEETEKLFSRISEPVRRSTRIKRGSLARFAYESGTANLGKNGISKLTYGSDIEDAVKLEKGPSSRAITRKRKRTTTVIVTSQDPNQGVNTEVIESERLATASSPSKPPRVRKPARTITDPMTSVKLVQPPPDWEEIYALVKEMRTTGRATNAAVDTMGCERLAGPEASARDRRFHTLVALMLSSQTKDTTNAEAMRKLKTEMPAFEQGRPPGLNLENMLAVDPAVLNELIGKVGFHNNKTKYLKQAAVILRHRYNSDIPDTIEGLISLPGVGPKMAHLCMSSDDGWGRIEGIGVDVHVHRITNLWGWQNPPSKNPEETRRVLERWLPRALWKEINWLLVGFGQTICLPVGRKCGECELGLRGLCKSAETKKVVEGQRKRQKKEEVVQVKNEEGENVGLAMAKEGIKV